MMASTSLQAFVPVLNYLQAHLLLPYPYEVAKSGKIRYTSGKRKAFCAAIVLYILVSVWLFVYQVIKIAKNWERLSFGEIKGQIIAFIYMTLIYPLLITMVQISWRLKKLLNKLFRVLDMCGELTRTDWRLHQLKLSRIIWSFLFIKISLFTFSFCIYTEFKLNQLMYGLELLIGSVYQFILYALEELAFIMTIEFIPAIQSILGLVKGIELKNAKVQTNTLKMCREMHIDLYNVANTQFRHELSTFLALAVFENAFNIIFMGIISFYFQTNVNALIKVSLLVSIFPPAMHLSLLCWAGSTVQSKVY